MRIITSSEQAKAIPGYLIDGSDRRFAQDRIEWAIAREGKDNLLSGALNDTGFLSLARALLTQFGSITDLHRQFVKHLAMQRMCYKLS